MNNNHEEIDLVYLWVNGADPKWQEKKRKYTGKVSDNTETNNIGRYVSNDELKYSLRSVEKYVPWIRKIFILTDDQKPEWLNTAHPKIQVVDHKEIMPAEILPCFNSTVIEYFLYRIPGLAEHFLFANDDMFFNTDLSPDFFFAKDGFPIVRLKRKLLGKWTYRLKPLIGKKPGQYASKIYEGALLVEKKWGKYYPGVPHHNIDAYRKSEYQKVVGEVFAEQIKMSQPHRLRTNGDMHRSAFAYYWLAIDHAHLKYVGRTESSRLLPYRHNFENVFEKIQTELVLP
ncbi:MAG: stealth family protein [Cyclobacteriaceae bacterium]|nr:stealth family protein [Cyclobacteriaceae bacterium]